MHLQKENRRDLKLHKQEGDIYKDLGNYLCLKSTYAPHIPITSLAIFKILEMTTTFTNTTYHSIFSFKFSWKDVPRVRTRMNKKHFGFSMMQGSCMNINHIFNRMKTPDDHRAKWKTRHAHLIFFESRKPHNSSAPVLRLSICQKLKLKPHTSLH